MNPERGRGLLLREAEEWLPLIWGRMAAFHCDTLAPASGRLPRLIHPRPLISEKPPGNP